MALYVYNSNSDSINVSFLVYDQNCAGVGQPYRKKGWFRVSPGQNLKIWDVDLTSVNRYAGTYAYTFSGDKSWQGNGELWIKVSDGVHFDQCMMDDTNCTKSVDYIPLDFDGSPNFVAIFGQNANEIYATKTAIYISPGPISDPNTGAHSGYGFYLSGSGFIPNTTVGVSWSYSNNGSLTNHAHAGTLKVSNTGTFNNIYYINTMTSAVGMVAVQVDTIFGDLSASATKQL